MRTIVAELQRAWAGDRSPMAASYDAHVSASDGEWARAVDGATVLVLARHGETEWNRTHRWQGFTGPSLTDLGRQQAERLAISLPAVDAIYSSDTTRVRETASIIASHLDLPVIEDARLREVNFGEWESLTREEINDRYSDVIDRWDAGGMTKAPPGGETDTAMAARVLEALHEIAAKHVGQHVLVVTSGGPIRAVQAHVAGIEQAMARRHFTRVENCAVVEMLSRDGVIAAVAGHVSIASPMAERESRCAAGP
jgi:broad specificity phosphatase PhoE